MPTLAGIAQAIAAASDVSTNSARNAQVVDSQTDSLGNVTSVTLQLPDHPNPIPQVVNLSGVKVGAGDTVNLQFTRENRHAPQVIGAGGGTTAALASQQAAQAGATGGGGMPPSLSGAPVVLAEPSNAAPYGYVAAPGSNMSITIVAPSAQSGGSVTPGSITFSMFVMQLSVLPNPATTLLLDGTLAVLLNSYNVVEGLYLLQKSIPDWLLIASPGGGSGEAYTGSAPIVVTGTNISVEVATTSSEGVVQLEASSSDTSASHVVTANDTRLLTADGVTIINNGSGVISAAAAVGGLQAWNSALNYVAGNIVIGSDTNLYVAVASSTNHNPTTDTGSYWNLWYLESSLTLNCGNGQRFGGTTSDPAGLQAAINFCNGFVGGTTGQTITIQIANNPTLSVTAGASSTVFTTTTALVSGQTLVTKSGTAANIGEIRTVSTVTGPVAGQYTVTMTSGFTSTPSASDVMIIGYSYAGNTIFFQNAPLSRFVSILGDTTNVQPVPQFYPSTTTAATGGSIANGSYYAAMSYTLANGTTMAGPVTLITVVGTGASTITFAAVTLPAGVTSINYYLGLSATGNSGLHLQGTGTGGAKIFTSYSSGGAAPAVINAPYPCWLSWTTAQGLNITFAQGLKINGLYLTGNGATSSQFGMFIAEQSSVVLGENLVVSNWGTCIAGFGTNGALFVEGVQVDNGVTYGFQIANAFALQDGIPTSSQNSLAEIIALFCGVGLNMNQSATAIAYNAYSGNCTTGFSLNNGCFARIVFNGAGAPTAGTGEQTFGTTTAYSPSANTVGNANSYIATT